MGDGLQAWELVRLELESFSDCSGENKNRMAGKWEVKDWKNSFFSRKKNCKQLSFASLNQEATEKKKNCILSFYAEGKEQGYSNLLRKGTEV